MKSLSNNKVPSGSPDVEKLGKGRLIFIYSNSPQCCAATFPLEQTCILQILATVGDGPR